jgi:hypothetical protein
LLKFSELPFWFIAALVAAFAPYRIRNGSFRLLSKVQSWSALKWRMSMHIALWICVLLLAYLCYMSHTLLEYLRAIAISASDINRQMIAFINAEGESGKVDDEATRDLSLGYQHLKSWGYLGRRFYSNQASWEAKFKEECDKAEAKRMDALLRGDASAEAET